jgi:hypothetical protein
MNIHHLVPSVSRWLLSMGSLILAVGLQQPASGADLSKFRRIEPQFIAALGDPAATSGNGPQSWDLWNQDPGPRACKLDHYPQLRATGVASGVEFRRFGLVAGRTRLDHGEADLPAASWEIPRHG